MLACHGQRSCRRTLGVLMSCGRTGGLAGHGPRRFCRSHRRPNAAITNAAITNAAITNAAPAGPPAGLGVAQAVRGRSA